MGGTFVEETLENTTPETLHEEYRKLYEQALFDNGHSGYSGSFAEKPEVVIRSHDGYWDEEEAQEDVWENDKWGPSFAYQIGETTFWIAGTASS